MGFFGRKGRRRQGSRPERAGRHAAGGGAGTTKSSNQRPGYYRSAACPPLRPWQVRAWRFRACRFRACRFGRRGLDPDEVQEFLDRVADDLAAVYAALGNSVQEAVRFRDALRRWQAEQVRRANAGGGRY